MYTAIKNSVMPRPNIKRIHVNSHQIRKNKKNDEDKPIIVAKAREDGKQLREYGRIVDIIGHNGEVVAQVGMHEEFDRGPLSCGAVAWVQTRRPICIRDKEKKKCRSIGSLENRNIDELYS